MKAKQLICPTQIRRILFVIVIFCGSAFGAKLFAVQLFIDSPKADIFLSATAEKQRKLNVNSKLFELSISTDDKEFNLRESIKVKAKIKNLYQEAVTLEDLKHVVFYLSKCPEDETDNGEESKTYGAAFYFVKNDSINPYTPLLQGEDYKFEVNLRSLKWSDVLQSITDGKQLNSLSQGKYSLYMQLSLKDEEKSDKPKIFPSFQSFKSNEITLKLTQKEN